ncbi:major capsid protein [Olivibacter sp. 47]|uniref:major capsid protein n=1 Tax=Olivibacter sp. 47 TaxID=3056486 RepID=UPI0025A346AB|nr:major capsid protein [Olivibacter sp. 47]MDM8174781.1 major capsid protein [Olivibacter sp. 47]
MQESLFIQWAKKYLPGIVIRTVTTLNGEKPPLPYWHRRLLKKDFSITGKWESKNISDKIVAADYVAMDSSLPLKSRPKIRSASGDIPKMGIEFTLNEQQLTELDDMVALKRPESQIVAKLFEDTPRAIGGIYEKNELAFLRGFSTGITLIEDADNVGTGVRVDYGYLANHKFTAPNNWGANANPLAYFDTVLDQVQKDQNAVDIAYMNRKTWRSIAATDAIKQLYAFSIGYVGSNANIPTPSLTQANAALKDQLGFEIEIVERKVTVQKNGVDKDVTPWDDGAIIFTKSGLVGSLVWARLAEASRPVPGVTYQVADEYILASKFSTNRPSLKEFTTAQARAIPVIGNVDNIYLLKWDPNTPAT